MQRPLILFVVATLVLGTLLSLRVQAQQAELLGPAGGSGTIEGTSTRIASRVGGRIVAVHVKEGEQVQPGQAILDFDCAEPDSALAEAEARLWARPEPPPTPPAPPRLRPARWLARSR